ncbi:MAG: glycogen debranching N-terminal domain-containing protein [Pseudonocardiaceae bacterium]
MAGAAPDMDGPDFDGIAPQGVLAGPGTITVIAGLTFAISDERGDIGPGPFGLITDDTRHLSRLQVRPDSEPLRHLGSGLISPAVARFRCYATLSNRLPDAPVECERLRELSPAGMVETLGGARLASRSRRPGPRRPDRVRSPWTAVPGQPGLEGLRERRAVRRRPARQGADRDRGGAGLRLPGAPRARRRADPPRPPRGGR